MKRIFVLAGLMSFSALFAQKKHTVEKGDTAYNISKRYGMSLDEFYRLNPKVKEGVLNIGDVLVVKGKEKKEALPAKSGKLGTIILQPKQTLYGLTRQYHITEAEIRKLNPNLMMQIGEEISLPIENIEKYADKKAFTTTAPKQTPEIEKPRTEKPEPTPAGNGDEYVTHTVQSGDTVFGIINKYSISLDQLLELNPQIADGLKAGATIKIRKLEPAYVKKASGTLNIVLMMPFGFDSNDTKYRASFTDFLSGARLAMERQARKGLKMDVKIIDTGSEKSFKNSLSQINQENTDLIIGPFFKSNIIEVMDFLGDKKIPVVAPLANSEELYDYSNLVIMETADNIYSDRIAKEVVQAYNNEKIYIVSGADKSVANLLKQSIEKSLKKAQVKIITSADEISLDKNMMTGQKAPVIAIFASNSSKTEEGNAFTNKVIALTKETEGIKAFSLYHSPSFDKKVNELSQASLVYLVDRKINTDGDFEKQVLADYREKYCKTPSRFAIIGFDVVNDILSRENSRGELFKQMGKTQTQLATKFEYVRTKPNGAYINTGYRVVRLIPQ